MEEYLETLRSMGIAPRVSSRWINAASVSADPFQLAQIKNLPFVQQVVAIRSTQHLSSQHIMVNSNQYHLAMLQMGIRTFLKDSLTGKGVTVGIIDAGFYDAKNSRFLKHIFNEYKILGQRDFIDTDRSDLIEEKKTSSDTHGKTVLEMIAGFNESSGEQLGMAPNARFYLARTEHGDREYRGEEEMWVQALEWMDSQGVRLINTSLGYAIKMDNPEENYQLEDMNGKTTIIAKAAQIATTEKGIFLVVSAGNEGSNNLWNIISSPADAEGALSVGATEPGNCMRIDYSSIGPEFNPFLKPNVSCYSPNGTSFSAPAVCGFVACLMQKAPHLNNVELKSILEKSSSLYPMGNNYIGYGIPQADRALALLQNPNAHVSEVTTVQVMSDRYLLRFNNKSKGQVVLFHKKNAQHVISQQTMMISNKKIKIKKPLQAKQSTLVLPDKKIIELIW
ncbi:MAG: S8 family serine peptidase [Cytophagaceae bacterium]|nr:S8 family serine peptidase [Cytophagaceae bacterium]